MALPPDPTLPSRPPLLTALDELVHAFQAGADHIRGVALGQAAFAGVEPAGREINAWLPPGDVDTYHELGAPRESALRASRMGDAGTARAWLQEAERRLGTAVVETPTRLLLRSMHHAARAYLLYRAGDLVQARADLLAALDLTNVLHDGHGYPLAEARRLHLAHLVLRLDVVVGADPRGTLATAGRLWRYVDGDEDEWPFGRCARAGLAVQPRLAALTLNEMVTEAALLLANNPALDAVAPSVLARDPHRGSAEPDPFGYAGTWLELKTRLVDGRPEAVLPAAVRFLATVDGPRPWLWFAAVRDVRRYLRGLSHPAAGVLAGIFTTALPPCRGLPVVLGGNPSYLGVTSIAIK